MRRVFLSIIVIVMLLVLSACDLVMSLGQESENYDVYLVSVACNYRNTPGAGELEGTLNDQMFLSAQLSHLSSLAGVDYRAWLLRDGSVGEDGLNRDDKESHLVRIHGSSKTSTVIDQVDRDGIDKVIDEVASLVDGDDLVVFHYSGHGYEGTGDLFLPCTCREYRYPLDELASRLETIPCNRLIVLDSCYSGNIVDESLDDDRRGLENLFTRYEIPASRTWYSAASQDDEESYTDDESYPVPFGAHSAGILKALGFDIMSLRPDRPDEDVLTMNMMLDMARTEYRSQHSSSTSGTRDLVLFRFD